MSKAEQDFVNEYTRRLLVQWCAYYLEHGEIPVVGDNVFVDHAQNKGWISKKGDKILAAGFKTAASYLRR